MAGELQLKFRYPNPPKKPPMTQTIIAVKTHPLPSPPAPRALPCGVCRKVRDLDHLGVAHPPPPRKVRDLKQLCVDPPPS